MATKRNALTRPLPACALIAGTAVATLLLAGCRIENSYWDRRDTIMLGAGDAKAHNRAVHTIDPWPVYAKDTDLPADGKRMMVGIKRYQENQSLEPVGANTAESFEEIGGPPPGPPPGPSE